MKSVIKACWKYPVLLIWFLLSVVIFEIVLNRGNTDLTKDINKASLPVAVIRYDGHDINKMFGYTDEIDFSLIRDGITPLSEDRSLSFRVYKKNNNIKTISYELRSVDDSRFIESGEIEDTVYTSDYIDARLVVKDLILDDTEYMLKIIVTTISGKEIYYYARVIKSSDLSFEEKIDYVYYFSECTFDKERAGEELVKYLESNKTGDNTNFNHVNIHSSLDMVTWSNLETKVLSDPVCYIEEIDYKSAIMKLEYLLEAGVGDEKNIYSVEEQYRFIKGSDRMYLLEFDRYMNTLIMTGNDIVFGNKLMLGICSEDIEFKENKSGNTYAFVNEGSLYIVNLSDNTFITAYSSYDEKNLDDRCVNDNHEIKLINVDDNGNVLFYVYGYFNNGNHEGKVGVNLFEYNSNHHVIEEKVFVQTNKSCELLKNDIEKMAYFNEDNNFILYTDDTLYSIDTDTYELSVLADNVPYSDFYVDISRRLAAWPSNVSEGKIKEISVLNAKYGDIFTLNAKNGEAIKPLGFMGEDFIYGRANISDISMNAYEETLFPMKEVNVVAQSQAVLKKYEEENVYVVDCQINDNLITLTRMEKDSEGNFQSIAPDSLVNIRMEETYQNNIETVATENLKKIVQISLKAEMDKKKLKIVNPKMVITENLNEVILENNETDDFYVFKGGENIGNYKNVSEAIKAAEEALGVVMDSEGHYIWKKETYRNVNQIMKITGTTADDENSSLETCIETVLDYYGYSQNVKDIIKTKEAEEILEDIVPDSEATVIVNCSRDSLKYYLNKDIPVIVMAGANSLVLVGYNESSDVWMNPQSGNIMKIDNEDADKFYEKYGKKFLVLQRWES